jgi:hypothetical protein
VRENRMPGYVQGALGDRCLYRERPHQIVSISELWRKFESAVTSCALQMIDVAAMILSAGSLLISGPKFVESSVISGEIETTEMLRDSRNRLTKFAELQLRAEQCNVPDPKLRVICACCCALLYAQKRFTFGRLFQKLKNI